MLLSPSPPVTASPTPSQSSTPIVAPSVAPSPTPSSALPTPVPTESPSDPGAQNLVPVAAFASSVRDLSVSVDGSGSADPDGSISSYRWDLGMGRVLERGCRRWRMTMPRLVIMWSG